MPYIVTAQPEDMAAWLALAAEVEPLFGPMVDDPGFMQALRKNVDRGTALCMREADGPPGVLLLGGLLYSPRPPVFGIGWLAVTRTYRRRGIGRALIERVFCLAKRPAEFVVTTFGADNLAGQPARLFYEHMGFHPAERAPNGPEGGSRQVYRRTIP